MAASAAVNEIPQLNPLLQDFYFPPFDAVEAKHVRPGILTLLKKLVCPFRLYLFKFRSSINLLNFTSLFPFPSLIVRDFQEGDLEELERTVEPSWSKLVEPLEKIVDRLNVVWGIVNHLKSVKDTADLRIAIEEVQVYSRYLEDRLRLCWRYHILHGYYH